MPPRVGWRAARVPGARGPVRSGYHNGAAGPGWPTPGSGMEDQAPSPRRKGRGRRRVARASGRAGLVPRERPGTGSWRPAALRHSGRQPHRRPPCRMRDVLPAPATRHTARKRGRHARSGTAWASPCQGYHKGQSSGNDAAGRRAALPERQRAQIFGGRGIVSLMPLLPGIISFFPRNVFG